MISCLGPTSPPPSSRPWPEDPAYKEAKPMPIRRSPNGPHHPRPQPGRDRPEQVVAINRNDRSQSIGTGGRDHPVRARCRRNTAYLDIPEIAPASSPGAVASSSQALQRRVYRAFGGRGAAKSPGRTLPASKLSPVRHLPSYLGDDKQTIRRSTNPSDLHHMYGS